MQHLAALWLPFTGLMLLRVLGQTMARPSIDHADGVMASDSTWVGPVLLNSPDAQEPLPGDSSAILEPMTVSGLALPGAGLLPINAAVIQNPRLVVGLWSVGSDRLLQTRYLALQWQRQRSPNEQQCQRLSHLI